MSTHDFYRAFEDRHRGSRALIASRLEAYLPLIAPLAQLYTPAAAIDLGCGRGEWLELIAQHGFIPQGVDLDEGMLAACHELGLPAVQGDAIAYLKSLADHTQCIVSGFHVAEHIPFAELETLVDEALRILQPGGLLILETPNPENIAVGTNSFYLDPTHVRPLPPLLLSFLAEHHGFCRVKTVRLQEAPDLHHESAHVGLLQVLEGVSPDYAIVAQKGAPAEVLAQFDAAFAAPYGIGLAELANRHDIAHAQRLAVVEQRITNAETHSAALTEELARIAKYQAEIDALRASYARIADLEAERNALHSSLSWRITAPLRGAASFVASPLSYATGRILQNPRLAKNLNGMVRKFPSLHARLRSDAIDQGMMEDAATPMPTAEATALTVADLSPKAKQIHAALLQAIAHEKG